MNCSFRESNPLAAPIAAPNIGPPVINPAGDNPANTPANAPFPIEGIASSMLFLKRFVVSSGFSPSLPKYPFAIKPNPVLYIAPAFFARFDAIPTPDSNFAPTLSATSGERIPEIRSPTEPPIVVLPEARSFKKFCTLVPTGPAVGALAGAGLAFILASCKEEEDDCNEYAKISFNKSCCDAY